MASPRVVERAGPARNRLAAFDPVVRRTRTIGSTRLALAAALVTGAALEVAWRIPFLRFPITTDEGGFAEIARLWSRGGTLYADAWVDRPQGLLLVFRGLLFIDGGSPVVLRSAAIVAALLLFALVVLIAHEIGGRRLAAIAALLLGLFGSSPLIESFTLSGELLASLPSAAAILCLLRYLKTDRAAWLVAVGLFAGCAVMIKQSAFDAGLAVLATLFVTRHRSAWKPALLVVGAWAVPVVIAVITAPSAGRWWSAVVAYRGQSDSIVTGSVVHRAIEFVQSGPALCFGLVVFVVLALHGWRRTPTVIRAWLLCAVVGVLGGGHFFTHYYLQLVPPLAIVASLGLLTLIERPVSLARWAPIVAVSAVALVAAVPAYRGTTSQRVEAVFPLDLHLATDAQVSAYVRSHTRPGQRILVVPPLASIYYLADRPPAFRYIWTRPIVTAPAPGARKELRNALRSRSAAMVISYSPLRRLDPSGRAARELRLNYRRTTTLFPAALRDRLPPVVIWTRRP